MRDKKQKQTQQNFEYFSSHSCGKALQNKNKKERQGVLRSKIKHQRTVGRRLHLTRQRSERAYKRKAERKREPIVDFVGNLLLGVSCNHRSLEIKEQYVGAPGPPLIYHLFTRSIMCTLD